MDETGRHTEKDKYGMVSLICGMQEKKPHVNREQKLAYQWMRDKGNKKRLMKRKKLSV